MSTVVVLEPSDQKAQRPETALPSRSDAALPQVDFSRPVVCLLGLPFDQVNMLEAGEQIFAAAKTKQALLLSTVNINFVVAARTDVLFRQSILTSHLSLADGMPIVWVSRLLGVALPERVPGSSLFESLCAATARPPLKVFFFGAPDGVAERASERINASSCGVRCVGFHAPGFASVAAMSSDEQIQAINASNPDFVIVALGAQKGQSWIERNRKTLTAPVISHLGAVIGMTAGELKRAPILFQRLGLEWLWRIKEEPHLWRRYWRDGSQLLRLTCTQVLPLMLHRWVHQLRTEAASPAPVGRQRQPGEFEVRFGPSCGTAQLGGLQTALEAACQAHCLVTLNFSQARFLDAQALGKLLLLYGHQVQAGLPVRLVGVSPGLARLFRCHGLGYLLQACSEDTATQDSSFIGMADAT